MQPDSNFFCQYILLIDNSCPVNIQNSRQNLMSFQIESSTYRWLLTLGVFTPEDSKPTKKTANTYQIGEELAKLFENGTKVSVIVQQLCRKKAIPIPQTLNHLKHSNNTAAQLYNWNILNETLKKMSFQIDSETKNMVINGDRDHLNIVLRKLQIFHQENVKQQTSGEKQEQMEDSLDTEKINQINRRKPENGKVQEQPLAPPPKMQKRASSTMMRQSLSLSHSEQPLPPNQSASQKASQPPKQNGDLLEYVVSELIYNLKLTRKQAIALLSDNNKYLAHVLVKGIKGQFNEIDELMSRFYSGIDSIIEKMLLQKDMCFFFLQILKPSLLSKSEEIAQWGCRLLSRVAHELAERQMLPLAYDWFVREAGGLSTTILALSRHPKLNQHVVGYILEFSRYNVTELFTIELKKITNNDNLNYVKFMLLIFEPLVESKLSAEELLSSGAIDYWVEMALKNAENEFRNTNELRLYSIEFLIKIWRAYPIHIEETLDQVNAIMACIKKGIRETSEVMRFSLVELMFDLLDEFASKKNPYASIVYKKLTFLFIENHQEHSMREFMLRNFSNVFRKYSSIPVEIFLEPFIKQVKISESKSYILDIFDMEFIQVAAKHKKLKVNIGLELYDLLAKTQLNSHCYVAMAVDNMNILLDRFLDEEQFFDYTVKLVKISLAMLYSTLKHKKPYGDQERLQAQKRAEIVNFIISLIERNNPEMNEEIKGLVVHVKLQIQNRFQITHKGIERILSYYSDVEEAVMEAMQNIRDRDETESNATNKTKSTFHLPKIEPRNQLLRDRDRDETSSQQSFQTNASKFSKVSSKSRQEFPAKDYTQYAEEDEKKYVKQNNIASLASRKNAFRTKKNPYSADRESSMDPKIQSHINKIKERKEQDEIKRFKEKEALERKKELLKQKIQKELEQRNIKDGLMGHEKDVQVQVVFEENQLNQKLFAEEEDFLTKNISVDQQEQRDAESLRLVIRRNVHFIKKIFTKYASAKVVNKDYFQEKTDMTQADLLRLCKEKNIQRSKVPIIEILKQINNKNIKSISIDLFPSFLETLCVYLYFKEKTTTHIPMGQFMHKILRKMAVGENTKLDDEQDEQCRVLGEKIRYNPQTELPEGFKKVHERVYLLHNGTTYPVKKAISKQSYLDCYQVLSEILSQAFKFEILEEQVRFREELKVIHKKQAYMPPKPNMSSSKKDRNADQPVGLLLKDTEVAPSNRTRKPSINRANRSGEKQNFRGASSSKERPRIINAAQKKKKEEQEQNRIKKQHEEQMRKIRQLEVKKKLEKETQEREAEKARKKQQEKLLRQEEEQKKQRELQEQQKYKQKQRQKVEKYRKEQQEKEKEEKQQRRKQREKEDQEKREKLNKLKSKEDLKRQQERQKLKRERELSEERKQKAKEDEERKKQNLRKQVQKKLLNEKQKYEAQKGIKQLTRQIYSQSKIVQQFSDSKEQLKAMFNYGRQYNEYKLGGSSQNNQLESKGWLTLCQQFKICDVSTANKLMKTYQKESSFSGFSYEQFEEVLFTFEVKSVLEKNMDNYDVALKESHRVIRDFLHSLSIPKDKLLMKDFFLNLKNEKGERHAESKKRRKSSAAEIAVTNSNGEKENWQLQEEDNN